MADEKKTESARNSRWWENYVVRYLLGTAVGIGCVFVILSWIPSCCAFTHGVAKSAFDAWAADKDAGVRLPLYLALSGFVFAVLAAAPVTVFHAARSLETNLGQRFSRNVWLIFAISSIPLLISLVFARTDHYLLIGFLAFIAIYLWANQWAGVLALLADEKLNGNDGLRWLRKRIGGTRAEKNEYVKWNRQLAKQRDLDATGGLRETYTHLREHANSVFVVLCELALCGFIVAALAISQYVVGADQSRSVEIVITILVGWLLPNVFLWGQANRLEASLAERGKP